MKKRTKVEIDRQIEGLINMKKTLPEYSIFGDANWKKINAQIAVLEGKAKPDDYYQGEHNDIWSDAERAEQWLSGHENEDLFE